MIHLLSADAYAGELPRPRRTGINSIFKARVIIEGERRPCYIKPLPDLVAGRNGPAANQELVSEALGYTLAKTCGFDVPGAAGVIKLPRQTIPDDALAVADDNTAGPAQDSFLAWFCEDMRYPDLVWHYAGGELDPKLADQVWRRISAALAQHDELPRLVTFDEWLQNSDRHPGNLLHAGEHRLALIDHGRIFHRPYWQAPALRTSACFATNRVADCVEATVPNWRDMLPVRCDRTQAYDEIGEEFRNNGEHTARDVLGRLMLDAPDIDAVVGFLAERLEPAHVQRATGMGSML